MLSRDYFLGALKKPRLAPQSKFRHNPPASDPDLGVLMCLNSYLSGPLGPPPVPILGPRGLPYRPIPSSHLSLSGLVGRLRMQCDCCGAASYCH